MDKMMSGELTARFSRLTTEKVEMRLNVLENEVKWLNSELKETKTFFTPLMKHCDLENTVNVRISQINERNVIRGNQMDCLLNILYPILRSPFMQLLNRFFLRKYIIEYFGEHDVSTLYVHIRITNKKFKQKAIKQYRKYEKQFWEKRKKYNIPTKKTLVNIAMEEEDSDVIE